jgi:hypothetical protein
MFSFASFRRRVKAASSSVRSSFCSFAEECGDLADPALEAPALGLQLEGLRVAGCQRSVEGGPGTAAARRGRRSEQLANVVDQHAVLCLSWGVGAAAVKTTPWRLSNLAAFPLD